MKLMEIYRQIVIEAENDYRGQHSAPGKDDAPLHDLTKNDIIPDDIYSRNAIRYYGTGFDDNFNFAMILKAKLIPAPSSLNMQTNERLRRMQTS